MKRVSDADLRLLRIFSTVAESRGFAAAQAALNLSAPSISGYITALEQRLGVRLCSRGRSGFALTDKGAVIYREAQRLFGAMDEFVSHAGAVKGRTTGTLRIGLVDCTVSDPNAPIARAIQRFNQRENDVRIELSIAAPTALQRNVLERRLHLAIASFPVEVVRADGRTALRRDKQLLLRRRPPALRQGRRDARGHPGRPHRGAQLLARRRPLAHRRRARGGRRWRSWRRRRP